MTSSRTKIAVTEFSRLKSRFRVTLRLTNDTCIEIAGHGRTWNYNYSTNPSRLARSTYSTYWGGEIYNLSKDPLEDCIKWYEKIRGVCGRQIDNFFTHNPKPSITDWLRLQQDSIENVFIQEGRSDDVKYFLENIRVTGSFELIMSHFEMNFQLEIPEDPTHLLIYTSKFINYDQLIRLKAREINLRQSILTNRELNGFLKSWMSCESHLDLEKITINISEEQIIDEIMVDLPHEVGTDGYKIKRSDGKEANVKLDRFGSPCLYLKVQENSEILFLDF
uniref:FBA_2 domain-containing protein n=1 Tax=Caenorhabditis tropicalis TaxID=1561998 RepID=A0A1I7TUM4_9PELO